MNIIRCGEKTAEILAIVNLAAEAYRGVIPPDRWHEPYMSEPELIEEIKTASSFGDSKRKAGCWESWASSRCVMWI